MKGLIDGTETGQIAIITSLLVSIWVVFDVSVTFDKIFSTKVTLSRILLLTSNGPKFGL